MEEHITYSVLLFPLTKFLYAISESCDMIFSCPCFSFWVFFFFFFQKMPSVISIQSRVGWLIRPLVLYNHSGKNVLFHKYKAEKCLKNLQSICERRRQDQKIIHLLLELCPQSSRSSQRSWWNISWLFYILFCNLQNQSQSEDFSLLCYWNCEN